MARDGVDPLPVNLLPPLEPGTNMPLPGMPRYPSGVITSSWPTGLNTATAVPPGSHPFRGMGFSAYANAAGSTTGGEDQYGYNSTLDSTILRALAGDNVMPLATTAPPNAPDSRRRIFEVGTTNDHAVDAVDYGTKNRVLSKILQNTTTVQQRVFCVDPGRLLPGAGRQSPQRSRPHRRQTGDVSGVSRLLRDRSFPGAEA